MDHSERFSVRSKAATAMDDENRRADSYLPRDNPLEMRTRSVWDAHRTSSPSLRNSRRIGSQRSLSSSSIEEKQRNRQLIRESLNKSISLVEGGTGPITPPQRARSLEGPSLEEHFNRAEPERRGSGSSVRSGESTLSSRKRIKRKLKKTHSSESIDSGALASIDSGSLDSVSLDSASLASGSTGSAPGGDSGSPRIPRTVRKGRSKRKGRKVKPDNSKQLKEPTVGESQEKGKKMKQKKQKEEAEKEKHILASPVSRESRGDRAPVTPRRGPPSPRSLDGDSLEEDEARAFGFGEPLVTREGESPIRMTRSKSDIVSSPRRSPQQELTHSSPLAGDVVLSPRRRRSETKWTNRFTFFPPPLDATPGDEPDVDARKSRSKTSPPTPTQQKKVKGKDGKRNKFSGLPRLKKTFSLGTNKTPSFSDGKKTSKLMKGNPNSKIIQKVVKNTKAAGDDSTVYSGTEQTVSTASTVSTTQSDLSSLSEGQARAAVAPRSRGLTSIRTFSRLLLRLRTDFDHEASIEEEEEPTEETEDLTETSDDVDIAQAADLVHRGEDVLNRLDGAATGMMSDIDEGDETELSPPQKSNKSRVERQIKNLPAPKEESPSIRNKRIKEGVKSVVFGTVNVREYERSVGDNPAVSSGSPIGLGWAYMDAIKVDIETYESEVRKPGPRSRRDFFLTPQMRFRLLLDDWGYTAREISHAKDQASEIRYLRQISIFGDPSQQSPVSSRSGSSTSSRNSNATGMPGGRKNIKGASYSSSKHRGSGKLPRMPKVDTRWDSSCPAAPTMK